MLLEVLPVSVVDEVSVATGEQDFGGPQKALSVLFAGLELRQVEKLGEFVPRQKCPDHRLRVVKHVEATVTLFVLVEDW